MAQFGRNRGQDADAEPVDAEIAEPGTDLALPADAEVAQYSQEVIEHVKRLIADIPGDDGSGASRIVEQLLAAKTFDDLNEPWESTSGKLLAGKRLRIRDLSQRPSQFEGQVGIFLVVDASDVKTGEQCTFTTSAMMVIVQLAVARDLGMLPMIADVVVAERPTARGFYPYHLKVLAVEKAQAVNA